MFGDPIACKSKLLAMFGEFGRIRKSGSYIPAFDDGHKIQKGKFGHRFYMVIGAAKAKRNRLSFGCVP